jgi:regulator of cell morphogenesis and NO signaling
VRARPVLPNDRVSELLGHPTAARIFELLGIDVCCGAERTLAGAAEAAGISVEELSSLLDDDDSTPLPRTTPPEDFATFTLTRQIDHLVGNHHKFARRQLLRLDRIMRVVWPGHRGLANLARVRSLLGELLDDLIPHMAREERYLFPYMRSFEGQMKPEERISVPLFGNLQYPLASITHDHADDSNRLLELRKLTGGFAATNDACARVRNLFDGLSELERDIQEHIRIENQIVFPRAVELERSARMRATSTP